MIIKKRLKLQGRSKMNKAKRKKINKKGKVTEIKKIGKERNI